MNITYISPRDDIMLKENQLIKTQWNPFTKKYYESLGEALEKDYDKILNKAYNIQEYLEQNDFYSIKSKIGNVINGLGIHIEEDRKLKELSGGQRAKVFLGKMLLEEKDIFPR